MKKNTGLAAAILLLLITGALKTNAQRYFVISLRNGITREMAESDFYGSRETNRNLSWDQQLLLDIGLSKRFSLEPSITHYRVSADLSGQKKNVEGEYYNKYIIRNDVLRHQVLLLYSFINRKRLKLSIGGGFGVHISYNRYDIEFHNLHGAYVSDKNNLVSFEAISGTLAFNGKYQVNKKIDLNAQASCFTFSNAGLWGYGARMGVGYRLF